MKCLGFVLLFGFISLGAIGGCNNGNSNFGLTSGDRTITFINNCSQNIWIGVNGADPENQMKNCTDSPDNCPAGQACNTRAKPDSQCEWILPSPTSGSFELTASGEQGNQATFTIPISQAVGTGGQILNVNIYGQTGCTSVGDCTQGPCGGSCETAPCNAPSRDKPCETGAGPEGAHSQGELNLFKSRVDNYDISYLNGFNIPIEIKPSNVTTDSSNPYVCGNPGSNVAITNLNDCLYKFNTFITINSMTTNYAPYLRYVTNGGGTCTPTMSNLDPACDNKDEVCGLSMSEDFTTLATTCGTQIGWWNANEVCTTVTSFNEGPFDCQGSTDQGTFFNLYGCSGTNATDCYNKNSNTMCCGCPVWTDVPLPPCTNIDDKCCFNHNPTWENLAQPWAKFMKDACSTAFSFPNDDATSDFSCPKTNPDTNMTNYEVIFCPGGLTGLPMSL